MIVCHNSQNSLMREPFGAAECGKLVQLRIYLTECEDAKCTLRLWDDKETLIPMERDGEYFRAEIKMPEEPGLLWYAFVIESEGKTWFYNNAEDNLGGEGRLLPYLENSYQITVYRKKNIPAWYREGMMYQIFPDRFNRGRDFAERAAAHTQKRTMLPHILDTDWNDKPFYMKDENGDITKWPFFGGTLTGIAEKLDYLKEIGISILYLNPIFEASSCHRYDTADFHRVDPGLGDEESFAMLIAEAEKRGMKIILDGVFSHVGRDSVYFDQFGSFGGNGAYENPDSPYADWFKKDENGEYTYWWGVRDLPNADKNSEKYREFIYKNEDSVVRHWLRTGIKGWRLDVADELPDSFIEGIRTAMNEEDEDSILIGEVWEDASNKISYGKLRSYFNGKELDSTMNYPFRKGFIEYLLGDIDGETLSRQMMSLAENYPPQNFYAAMNLVGSHDRTRILSMLGGASEEEPKLSEEQYQTALRRIRIMFEAQMLFPGVPSVYYGDEAGLEGLTDPYNRATFPWGKVNEDIFGAFKFAADLRREYDVLKNGSFRCEAPETELYLQIRENKEEKIIFCMNASADSGKMLDLSAYLEEGDRAVELHTGKLIEENEMVVLPQSSLIIYVRKEAKLPSFGKRKGILCHISSLPGAYGCGSMGKESRDFIDYLAEKGYSLWQVLPLSTTGKGDSPYYSSSVFAGNELLIDAEDLFARGLVTKEELEEAKQEIKGSRIRFSVTREKRTALYQKAYERFEKDASFEKFVKENEDWLPDYALFMALKENFGGAAWQDWPNGARNRTRLGVYKKKLEKEIGYHLFVQYMFSLQLDALRKYANEKGICLFGDLPIYVADDSADVWANRAVFDLDSEGRQNSLAGVPPDYFAEDGQLWGNPLYRWDHEECLLWWEKRLKHAFDTLDYVRLDHFRGFEAFWEVPKEAKTAKEGHWKKGPGIRFFKRMQERFGNLPIIAEDLGLILPGVDALRNICGFLGMRVYQFSADYMFTEDGQADSFLYRHA